MAGTGKALIVPTKEELALLNRRLIEEYGGGFHNGADNIANPGTLEHTLEQMQASVFGHEIYPTLFDKAALLAWRIIAGHVFYDGNKRTGMAAARVFLQVNGRSISVHLDTVDVALRIATGQMTISELATWYSEQQ
jgi:death-on-curing protein